jgi:hypothetical protein
MATLSVTAEGQNGAVAVVGSLYFTGIRGVIAVSHEAYIARKYFVLNLFKSSNMRGPTLSKKESENNNVCPFPLC